MDIAILGAGTWGVALARMLSLRGNKIYVWSAIPQEIDDLSNTKRHRNLPGVEIPDKIFFTKDISIACKETEIIVFAVPSIYVRATAKLVSPFVKNHAVVNVAKGIETSTLLLMSEVIKTELKDVNSVVTLSGPTHAEEVAKDLPTTIVAACENIHNAEYIQSVFTSSAFRVYTNTDIKGVELCGALKNIIALAAGISTGLGYGDNTKAAIITRGLAEIQRIGEKIGCQTETFSGLAGMGDLIVTATSRHSRNNRCGYLIGQGYSIEDAMKQVGMVVEGINALPAAMLLAKRYDVELPICMSVNQIIMNDKSPKEMVCDLMGRESKAEVAKPIMDAVFERSILNNFNRRNCDMKRVITYGTFDLLHYGHINLLRRAKALGDYLIVVISTDEFNWNEKHKKCYFTYEQRKALVEAIRYVDLVIPETNWQQKRTDVHEYHIDTFVMGDDWKGKFDFLKEEGVEVVYLPRTPEISSSKMKHDLYDAASVEESKISHDQINTDPATTDSLKN